jgi:predicted nucleic acid-binding Zn ribbon protein
MTKAKAPRELKAVAADMCRVLGMTEAYDRYRALQIWGKVVGDAVSKVTAVESLKGKDLYIRVRSPSWRMELNFRKKDIVKRLNMEVGYEIVSDIIFR